MEMFIFREEEKPKFKPGAAGLFALLLLLLLFWFTANTPLFQLSAEEIRALEAQKREQERELTFRFLDEPEDEVEHENPRFLSDANRIRKSRQIEERPPENDDPISQGNTFELEKAREAVTETAQSRAAVPQPPVESPVKTAKNEPAKSSEEKTRETPDPAEEEMTRTEPEPVVSGNVPTDPGAPKPYRKLSSEELAEARQKARQEMTALSLQQARSRETDQYHNPTGSAAPALGMSVETSRSDLGAYLKILKQLVKGNWRVPNIARFEVSGVTVIYFKIHKNGKFSDARVVSSSQHEPLDTSALNAIINTYQAPPLPDHVDEEWIPIRFAFYYNMRPRY